MNVSIVNYNPNWKTNFESEYQLLTASIEEDEVFIEHIGSTSIEGMGAKPIIDMMMGLKNFETSRQHVTAIKAIGYEHVTKHDHLIPNRRYFTKKKDGIKTHHLHVVEYQSEIWNRHLEFRDYLRSNPDARSEYYDLKLNLAKRNWNSGSEYADAKSEFIQAILQKIKND